MTEEKAFKKRKVFKEDLKELKKVEWRTETGSWFQITGHTHAHSMQYIRYEKHASVRSVVKVVTDSTVTDLRTSQRDPARCEGHVHVKRPSRSLQVAPLGQGLLMHSSTSATQPDWTNSTSFFAYFS